MTRDTRRNRPGIVPDVSRANAGPCPGSVPQVSRVRSRPSRCFGLILLLLALAAPAQRAAAEGVALTFDDLPVFGIKRTTAEQAVITRRLLGGLVRHHLPATGFVNEINLEGPDHPARVALLRRWLDAGMDLGNHGYSHLSLTVIPVADYIADTARGDTETKALLAERGRPIRWFRYPYLETGPTTAIRRTFEDWLASAHYRAAPVTLENADYQFADPYDAALAKGDRRRARAVRREYLAYTARVVPWYRAAALALFDRRPPLIWLLHASRLNADSIAGLAKIVRHEGLSPVTLDTAIADPAYAMRDDYAGPNGIEWLERWATMLHRDLPWNVMPKVPGDIAVASAELDAGDDHEPP